MNFILPILEDVSPQMQQLLYQYDNELRIAAKVFEAQEGIIVTDANNIIVRVNQALTTITGYSSDELIGRNPKMLSSGRHGVEFYRDMWDIIHEVGSWSGEVWNRRRNGEVYPEYLTISVVRDVYDVVINYVAILTDITMSKTMDEGKRSDMGVHHGMSCYLEYRLWNATKNKCYKVNTEDYQYWGAKGATICDRWRYSFQNFYADLGPRPTPKHRLKVHDRSIPIGPGNAEWYIKP